MAVEKKTNKDQGGNRYRPAQARPQTLEQLRQYVWQELQQIGGALSNADDSISGNCLPLCDDLYDGGGGTGERVWIPPDADVVAEILWEETELEYDDEGMPLKGMLFTSGDHIFIRRGWGGACKYSPDFGQTWQDRTLPPAYLYDLDGPDPQRAFLVPYTYQLLGETLYCEMHEYEINASNRNTFMATVDLGFNTWTVATWNVPEDGIWSGEYLDYATYINGSGELIAVGRRIASPDANYQYITRYDSPVGSFDDSGVISSTGRASAVNAQQLWVYTTGYTYFRGFSSSSSDTIIAWSDLDCTNAQYTLCGTQRPSHVGSSSNGVDTMLVPQFIGNTDRNFCKWTFDLIGADADMPVFQLPAPPDFNETGASKISYFVDAGEPTARWIMVGPGSESRPWSMWYDNTNITGEDAAENFVLGPSVIMPTQRALSGLKPIYLWPAKDGHWFGMYRAQETQKLTYVKFRYGTYEGDGIEPAEPIKDGAILEWVEADQEWCKSYRTRFISEGYISGNEYRFGDEVSNGSQISEAITQGATEYPFVTPTGEPYNVYAGTMGTNSATGSFVTFGNRYTITSGGYITGYRVNVVSGQRYKLYLIIEPTGANPQVRLVQDFTAPSTGWADVGVSPTVAVPGETFDLIAQASELTPVVVEDTLSYNYNTPNNFVPAGAGEIVQADKSVATLSVNHTDNNAVDQTAIITAMSIGDTITRGNIIWTINGVTDNGTFTDFLVTPSIQDSPDGVADVVFSRVTPAPITYPEDPGYWGVNQEVGVNAQGLIGVDVPPSGLTVNDTAYGVDLKIQAAYVPTQWKVKVIA